MNFELDQSHFLVQIGVKQIISMFDLVPGVLFWIKDVEGRWLYANQAFVEHLGKKRLDQIVGKTDHDFFPSYMAKQFVVDDQKVVSGVHITDRIEMNADTNGDISWYSTSKRPIYNDNDEAIGSYGITHHIEKMSKLRSDVEAIKTPVEFVRAHFMESICIKELAGVACLSVSALERRFKKHLGKSPKQFINETRLEHARRLLVETDMPVSQIAYESGFGDHSYFTKQFSSFFGVIPREFRFSQTA